MKIESLKLPEYRSGNMPNFVSTGKRIDDFIKTKYLGRKIAVRALSSSEHEITRDKLVEIILRDGTDRYDATRPGDRYENVDDKQIDIFAWPLNPLNKNDIFFEYVLESFYIYPLKTKGVPVFVDIIIIYDLNQLVEVEHRYEGRDDIKKDGFVFKNPNKKHKSIAGLILIN